MLIKICKFYKCLHYEVCRVATNLFCLIYCTNPKTVNTIIISGMLLCGKEKANKIQDEKTASCNDN